MFYVKTLRSMMQDYVSSTCFVSLWQIKNTQLDFSVDWWTPNMSRTYFIIIPRLKQLLLLLCWFLSYLPSFRTYFLWAPAFWKPCVVSGWEQTDLGAEEWKDKSRRGARRWKACTYWARRGRERGPPSRNPQRSARCWTWWHLQRRQQSDQTPAWKAPRGSTLGADQTLETKIERQRGGSV